MDKSKSKTSSSTSSGGSKKSHLHPSAGDLIALGGKRTENAPTATKPSSSSSSSSKGSTSASSKRDATSGAGNAPPPKKIRISPSRSTSSSSSSSHHHHSSYKKIKRDPLDPSTSSSSATSSAVPINTADLISDKFFSVLEKAADTKNHELAQNWILTSLKRLQVQKSPKETEQLEICQHNLLTSKTYPQLYRTMPIIDILVQLVQPKSKESASLGLKAKLLLATQSSSSSAPFAVFALIVILCVYGDESHWPIPLIQLWMDDASGDRSWVDNTLLKPLVENMHLSFGTMFPSPSLIPAGDSSGTGSGGGSSPNPAAALGDDSSTGNLGDKVKTLLNENLDFLQFENISIKNRYSGLETNVEDIITDAASDLIHKKAPDIPKNLLKALSSACGLSGVRAWVISRIEQWLHNGKLGRLAQELLLHLCVNANCNTAVDTETVTQICKLRLKTKPLIHFYSSALREMVRDNDSNLRAVLNQIIYNELSPQRNPNNLPILGTIFMGVPEAKSVLADIFMDLLQKREDFHPALRLLLREIVRSARFECELTKFISGLVKFREITWLGDCRERAFLAIADLTLLSMFLTVSPQVREASAVAAVRGEPKDISTLVNFRTLVSGIQSEAVTWMYSVVPKMFRPTKVNYLSALNKIYLKDPVNDLITKDGWPPESEKNLFGRLCLEVGLQETSLVFVLMMGVSSSKEHPLSANEALDIVEQLICRAAIHKTGIALEKIEIIELLFRLTEYRYPENISLPSGYEPPKMAVSNFYWRTWALLCVICAFNPTIFGKAGWSDYPTLKVFMEMCMTNSFVFPTASCTETETNEEIVSRELQTVAMEKEEILEFETHLAAASSKATITESNSLLLKQLMRLDPFGPSRTPPPFVLTQLQSYNEQMGLGHLLCGSRNPDFLLDLIQRNSEPMPWLARLVSEGSFEILPDQCLCEFFLMGRMDALEKAIVNRHEEIAPGRSPKKGHKGAVTTTELGLSKEDAKLLQLLHYLQERVHSTSEDGEARKVLEYFLRRLSAPKMQQRNQALKALKLLLIKEPETQTNSENSNADDWLLDGFPSLPAFAEIQENILVLLRQAISIENEPTLLVRYLEFLSCWAHLSEDLEGLALDVAGLVVERNGLMCLMFNKFPACFNPLFEIFSTFMKKVRGPHKESWKWSDSQDQVLVNWPTEKLEGSMNILIVHAIAMLLSSFSAHSQAQDSSKAASAAAQKAKEKHQQYKTKDLNSRFNELLDIWFPKSKDNTPKAFLLNTSEEAVLFPDWVKLKMVRSNNPRLLEVATQGLEVGQILLFIQSFGIPVQSMTALLYIMDTITERDQEALVKSVNTTNASFLYQLIQAQWKRGADGGEKFIRVLKSRCGVIDLMETEDESSVQNTTKSGRTPLEFGSPVGSKSEKIGQGLITHTRIHLGTGGSITSTVTPTYSPLSADKNKRKSIENLSKELLQLSSPPSNRRRSSVPTKGASVNVGASDVIPRRHSAHVSDKMEEEEDQTASIPSNKSPSKLLGQLVDQISEVEPCIVRNALEFQLPLLFGKSENSSGCRSFLMTALAHQAGWETINRCLTLFLKEFDPAYDPSAILDLIQATHTNPKLWQGVDKHVPKHQPNLAVIQLTSVQLGVMAEYIIEEISQTEMKNTKFSISNLLGPVQSTAPSSQKKKPKQGLQSRVKLWLQCAQQDKKQVDAVIKSLMDKKWRNPCVKRFIHQVYVQFPEVILIENWRWKAEDMNLTEDEMSSLLDSISHSLITALANTQPGKEWGKKQGREYEICLRKLASLHPTLLLRQLNLMGALLEGRIHLESSAFHQQNHNLPFIVFLALFDLMQPHILRHFKQLKSTFLLYFKMFKNYGTTKDYSSSLGRFAILLHNFLSLNSKEVKEFLNPHYATLRELATIKYYTEVVPLQNLLSCLDPISGGSISSSGGNNVVATSSNGDYLSPILTSIHDRLLHASNDDELIPVLTELDSLSNRNPIVLNKFSENLNLLLKSESESCRSLAFTLVLKHATYFPGKSSTYFDSIIQLLEDDNAHLRDTMMDRVHEFVILSQERGEDILTRMFQLGISSNVNYLTPIQKSLALLRNYSSLAYS